MQVQAVGYVGIRATDLEAWRDYAEGVLGTELSEGSSGDELKLRVDDYRWRISVARSEEDGFNFLGLELSGLAVFEEAIEQLRGEGVAIRVGSPAEVAARGVGGLAILEDPAGNRLELFHRPTLDYAFRSPKGDRFVTGKNGQLGFGHVVFLVGSQVYERCVDFYTRLMGFRLSECTSLGGVDVSFLHCNRRHHSIALASAPVTMCQHIMLQVEELDMVGRALDRAEEAKVPITSTLGRHRNDQMVSFYMRSPNGVDIEYGWGAREIEPHGWSSSSWQGGDVWGHKGIKELARGE